MVRNAKTSITLVVGQYQVRRMNFIYIGSGVESVLAGFDVSAQPSVVTRVPASQSGYDTRIRYSREIKCRVLGSIKGGCEWQPPFMSHW